MIPISIRHTFHELAQSLGVDARAAAPELAKALTFTAERVQKAIVEEMKTALDRPKRWTLNSVYKTVATAEKLEAQVWLKDDSSGGIPAAYYLGALISGGARAAKSTERKLQGLGLMRGNERMVPSTWAVQTLGDGAGNVKASVYVQIASQLRLNRLAGSDSNATNSKRSRRKRAKNRYFVAGTTKSVFGRGERDSARQHLPRGIWVQKEDGLKPVFLFLPVAYRARTFDFYGAAEKTVGEQLPRQLGKAVGRMIRGRGSE